MLYEVITPSAVTDCAPIPAALRLAEIAGASNTETVAPAAPPSAPPAPDSLRIRLSEAGDRLVPKRIPAGSAALAGTDMVARGAQEERKAAAARTNRITSYNVCYTKLLRGILGARGDTAGTHSDDYLGLLAFRIAFLDLRLGAFPKLSQVFEGHLGHIIPPLNFR